MRTLNAQPAHLCQHYRYRSDLPQVGFICIIFEAYHKRTTILSCKVKGACGALLNISLKEKFQMPSILRINATDKLPKGPADDQRFAFSSPFFPQLPHHRLIR